MVDQGLEIIVATETLNYGICFVLEAYDEKNG
jgi:hypothetical protein